MDTVMARNSESDNHDVWLNSNRAYREYAGMDEYYLNEEGDGNRIDREYEKLKEKRLEAREEEKENRR